VVLMDYLAFEKARFGETLDRAPWRLCPRRLLPNNIEAEVKKKILRRFGINPNDTQVTPRWN